MFAICYMESNRIKSKGKEAEEKLLMCINESDTEGNENVKAEINKNNGSSDKNGEDVNV